MPYIKVSPSALSSMSETLQNSSSKVGRIEDDFSGVARKLVWDVRSASDIQRRMDRIIDTLEDHARMLGDMRSFIDRAKRKYDDVQKEDVKLQKQYLSKVDKAIVALDKSMMTEAEKLEKRKEVANAWNWGVTIGCVVASIAVGVVFGPGIAMIAASTIVGATMAATSNLTDQYIEDGFEDGVDWTSLGTDVVIGTVTGAVSGSIGYGMNIGVKGIMATKTVSAIATQSTFHRIGTAATIGSVSEMVEGIAQRGAKTFIDSGGDIKAAGEAAFDGNEVIKDIAIGAIAGGGSEGVKVYGEHHSNKVYTQMKQNAKQEAQIEADEILASRNTLDVTELEKRTGLRNLKSARNGAVDFCDSDYILRNAAGEPASFKIKATGDLIADEKALNAKLREAGFNTSWKQRSKYGLYRMADYDATTGEYTVQVVTAHAANTMKKYSGTIPSAITQYQMIYGGGYGQAINSAEAMYKLPQMPEQTVADKAIDMVNDRYTNIADSIEEAYERNVEIDQI